MAAHTDTDWIREGATVAIYRDSYHGEGSYRTTTIIKLTKTQIVCDNNQRFNRERLTMLGNSGWSAPMLKPLDAPEIVRVHSAERFREVTRLADDLARDHRNGRRRDVLAMLDEIEQAVRAARKSITGEGQE
ncbi:hypothetical protein GCM10011608_10410 [Micromonospora sonchi]|uniref:Uncharacterized protein n=1 Tax=Micromonospora sonchi TaxID=1763543 RepID=A0A917TLH1_9ACTN|nr:hypothetical protein [Micromonospora sonchi]GGM27522.1 hypothetical protein GCM10011608_10410 [Micromonospora sonchi]